MLAYILTAVAFSASVNDGGAALQMGTPSTITSTSTSTSTDKEPNLALNGDFEQGVDEAGWDSPDGVKVRWESGSGVEGSRAICFEMDRQTAEGYGQGYFSNPIPVEPGATYTVRVAVNSDAPNAIIFVKGYATVNGREREAYTRHKEAHFDRYLALGEFTPIEFAFSPRHPTYAVEYVKIWLYGYLKPGHLWFDNVCVTKGGTPTPNPIPQPKPQVKQAPPRPPDPDGERHAPIYLDPKALGKAADKPGA